MYTFIRSLTGTVFLVFLTSLTAHVSVASTADSSTEGASGLPVQSDMGISHMQILAGYSSGYTLGALDSSHRISGAFWADAGEETTAVWLEVPNAYVSSMGFYLQGVSERERSPWPGRTDSPFELNDIQTYRGQNAAKYVTVTGVKPQLNANFSLDRSTREGWAINGNMVGTLPEPGTLLLMGLGLLGLGLARRRTAKKPA